jgi:large subunit ribosomal protein L32e
MADVKTLLGVRKKMSAKRPKFLRQDYHHRMKVEDDLWRAPKGRHSKMKQRKRGHRAAVAIGYRSPTEVRGLHKTGAIFIRVENLQQLAAVDPKKSIVILSSTVGARKRYQLLKASAEKNISIANINAKKFMADFEAKEKAKMKPKEEAKAEVKPKTAIKPETKTETKPKEITPQKTEIKTKEIPSHKVGFKQTQEDKFGA